VFENKGKITVFDGAIGTEAQKRAPDSGENLTELLNLSKPEVVQSIHHDYLFAGAKALTTNTFSANEIRLSRSGYGEKASEVNEKGVNLARQAVEEFSGESKNISVVGSIGPTGETLVPLGEWTFDQFYENFLAQARALKRGGADWIIIETMESLREAKAALVAAKEVGLPVISSLSFGPRGRTSYGVKPASGAVTLDRLGADVVGVNCGTGPKPYPDIIKTYSEYSNKPILAEANAGDPRLEDGKTVYDIRPEDYLKDIKPGLRHLSAIGSCCGSSPDFTKLLAEIVPEYEGERKSNKETGEKFIANNEKVISVSGDVEFREVKLGKGDLKNLKKKLLDGKVNLLRFTGFSESHEDLERVLGRQFLQLRSSNPVGIVTNDSELLKVFLKVYPGISPVVATGNSRFIKEIAGKYGGLLIRN